MSRGGQTLELGQSIAYCLLSSSLHPPTLQHAARIALGAILLQGLTVLEYREHFLSERNNLSRLISSWLENYIFDSQSIGHFT